MRVTHVRKRRSLLRASPRHGAVKTSLAMWVLPRAGDFGLPQIINRHTQKTAIPKVIVRSRFLVRQEISAAAIPATR